MHTREQYAVCLYIIQALSKHGSWCGETHIQKSSYVMQTLGLHKDIWDFTLYKHGPYSFDLHSTIENLRQMEYLNFIIKAPYGPQIRLSESGEKLLEKFKNILSPYSSTIEKTAEMLADKGVQQLEKIGTALLLDKEYNVDDENLLAEKLNKIKPHISIEEAVHAVRDYKNLVYNF